MKNKKFLLISLSFIHHFKSNSVIGDKPDREKTVRDKYSVRYLLQREIPEMEGEM